MSLDLNVNNGRPWIQGISAAESPLLAIPEEFLQKHPAWSIAHAQYFNAHPDEDCEYNRRTLALEMSLSHQADPQGIAVHVIRKIMTDARRDEFLKKVSELKSTGIVLPIIKFLGNLILNIVTLGLYGIFSNYLQDKQIARIEQKNNVRKQYEQAMIVRLHALGQTVANFQQRNQTNATAIEQAKIEINLLKREIAALPKVDLSVYKEIKKVKAEIKEAQKNLKDILAEDQNEPSVLTSEGGKGWARPAYAIKEGDPKQILGSLNSYDAFVGLPEDTLDPELVEVLKNLEICKNSETMDDLLRAEFKVAVNELLMLTKENNYIHFNRSSKILHEEEKVLELVKKKHCDIIEAIYKIMAFNMISRAELNRTSADDAALSLNKKGLQVASSQPFWTKPKEVVFRHHDAWTPSREEVNGVDPVSIKFLLRELESVRGDLGTLSNLLMAPLMDNNAKELVNVKELAAGKDKVGEILRTIEPLINDIAAMLQKRYQGALDTVWQEFFNDAVVNPFVKNTNVVPVVVANEDEDPMNSIKEWKPLELPIEDVEHPGLRKDLARTKDLITPIWKDIQNLTAHPLPNNAKIQTTKKIGPEDLGKQYWHLHLGISGHGCLFSALAVSLLQGATQKKWIDPMRLKDYLGDSILQAGDSDKTITKILAETKTAINPDGWTPDEYVQFLKNDQVQGIEDIGSMEDDIEPENIRRTTALMGDLELELLCTALDLHVEVFSDGGYYTIENGIMTSKRHYGAKNAKDKIVLYCLDGASWYALFPKVRKAKEGDSPELKQALNHAHKYWGANDGIEYNEWNNFKFPR